MIHYIFHILWFLWQCNSTNRTIIQFFNSTNLYIWKAKRFWGVP